MPNEPPAGGVQEATNCHFCGLQFQPDQNHPEHLCWDHLASVAMSAADFQMESERKSAELTRLQGEVEAANKVREDEREARIRTDRELGELRLELSTIQAAREKAEEERGDWKKRADAANAKMTAMTDHLHHEKEEAVANQNFDLAMAIRNAIVAPVAPVVVHGNDEQASTIKALEAERDALLARPWKAGVLEEKDAQLTSYRELAELWEYVEAMIASNVVHRTKGFRIGESTIQFALSHLADEHKELQDTAADCAMRDATRDELGDVLGVVIHLAILLKETPGSIARREIEKLKLRFEIPAALSRIPAGQPASDDERRAASASRLPSIEELALTACEDEPMQDDQGVVELPGGEIWEPQPSGGKHSQKVIHAPPMEILNPPEAIRPISPLELPDAEGWWERLGQVVRVVKGSGKYSDVLYYYDYDENVHGFGVAFGARPLLKGRWNKLPLPPACEVKP